MPEIVFSFLHVQYYPKSVEVSSELWADLKVFTKGVLFHIHKYLTRLTLTQTQKSTVQVASYHISSKHWSEQVKEQMTYHNQWTSELTSRAVLWSTVYVAFGQFIYEHSVLKFCIFLDRKKTTKGSNIYLSDSL